MISPFSSATEMLAALRGRQVSAVELLDLHVERIERLNARLNVLVVKDFQAAAETARAADEARARGDARPLLGLPITIKDCIDVAGLPGTAGVREFADRRPAEDGPVAAGLRAAGAVIVGKTNVPPWAGDWQADNPVYGRTNNPWDLARTSGGSTGGAAAVAAGLTPLELGSDVGGSIRLPAAFCGVYGHKPSETAVPRTGHFPGWPLPNPAGIMSVQGPLARSAADLELALEQIVGPEVGEDAAWRLELPPARHARLGNFRVAILPPVGWAPLDGEVVAALERVGALLGDLCARVAIAQPEGFGDLRDFFATYYRLLAIRVGRAQSRQERLAEAERARARAGIDTAWAEGLEADARDFLSHLDARERYRAAYRAFFRDWDVLVAPITLTTAFPHDRRPFAERRLVVNGQPTRYNLQIVYPAVATLGGQPATAVPIGLSSEGLPIGLQAIGPYLEDRTTIRFAELLGRELGGLARPPGYD
ncbi:MAG TPA: amidase [Chloroflexota bacterium]